MNELPPDPPRPGRPDPFETEQQPVAKPKFGHKLAWQDGVISVGMLALGLGLGAAVANGDGEPDVVTRTNEVVPGECVDMAHAGHDLMTAAVLYYTEFGMNPDIADDSDLTQRMDEWKEIVRGCLPDDEAEAYLAQFEDPGDVAEEAVAAETAGPSYVPTEEDFELTVKTLGKECFGSAGCNIDFRVEVTKVTNETLDPGTTYELTYEVTGGEDPYVNTLTLEGDQYVTDDQEYVGTASSDDELAAVVLSVTER